MDDKLKEAANHQENKTEERLTYQRTLRPEGQEVEIHGFYMKDPMVIDNPPDYEEEIVKLIEVLKGTGISKITITFLARNLS